MSFEPLKVEIISTRTTHFEVKFLNHDTTTKVAKHFFRKRVNVGVFEVVNSDKLPSI